MTTERIDRRNIGRPTVHDKSITDYIFDRMAGGESLKRICEDPAMPAMQTVFKWLRIHPELSENYARAIIERADAVFEDMFAIADDGSNDTYVDDEGNQRTDYDVINRSKLRIDTRKWALSRMNPKKYGDKITQEHTGADGNPLAFVIRDMTKGDA